MRLRVSIELMGQEERDTGPVIYGGNLLLVGLGGAAGTLGRYALGAVLPYSEPLTILGVNLVGALVLGTLVTLLAGLHPRLQLFLGTGLCGGFTTYSAFAVGTVEYAGAPLAAVVLALGTVVGGVAATMAGVWIGSALRRSHDGRSAA